MFGHRLDEAPSRSIVFHWYLLCFNGGCINAGGFLATGRFVSHVTGFATLFGVDLINRRMELAFGMASVPVFFLLGAFLAGLLIEGPIHKGKRPHFSWVMGLASLCLWFAAAGNWFKMGHFNVQPNLRQSYLLLSLLCLASGLQNAAITASSGRTVRTTHLTGLTTDLGLGVARLIALGKVGRKQFQFEWKMNRLRIGSILAFIFGSAGGAWIFEHWGYLGFCFSAMLNLYVAIRASQTAV